jgi:tRNA threonylcarbamoyladenosine biosynthesis protein TsaE
MFYEIVEEYASLPIIPAGSLEIVTESPDETRRFGNRLGQLLTIGDVICLSGDLGAGKTTFASGIGQGWNNIARLPSPTYTIMNVYKRDTDGQVLHHVDAYRLETPEALWSTGIDDIFDANGSVLIEWPERIESVLPDNRLWVDIQFDDDDDDRRLFILTAHGDTSALLDAFRRAIYGF